MRLVAYAAPVDALADELLVALRDHPHAGPLMDPTNGDPHRKLCAAYNRLYCELHDKAPAKETRERFCVCCTPPQPWPHEATASSFVNALTLHKQRISQLQEALCECSHESIFQADLHDETCPVFTVTRPVSNQESRGSDG